MAPASSLAMPRVDLAGIVLLDASSGRPVDLGALSGPTLLSLLRHRH
jgi:hypothetical protein